MRKADVKNRKTDLTETINMPSHITSARLNVILEDSPNRVLEMNGYTEITKKTFKYHPCRGGDDVFLLCNRLIDHVGVDCDHNFYRRKYLLLFMGDPPTRYSNQCSKFSLSISSSVHLKMIESLKTGQQAVFNGQHQHN